MVGRTVPAASIPLSKPYSGQSGFLRFIQDFSNGKKSFGVNDFADAAVKLRPYEIKTIQVHYLVDAPTLAKLLSLPSGAIVPATISKE